MRALQGMRVADFTWVWAGSYATMLLALLGAEVIKVESHQRPDMTRTFTFSTGQVFADLNRSTAFNDLNLNKLSVTLNLSHPKGVELAKRIVSVSDAAAENMRPGIMEKLGLGYSALREVKPDIVYLSSSACGARGPERHHVGYAPTFAALGGLSHITGYPDAEPASLRGPIDLRSATAAAFALMAGLYHHQRTGRGQYIDFSSWESIAFLIGEVFLDLEMNGRARSRNGNRDQHMAPHNCYPCRGDDKWVSIAVSTDEEWQALRQTMGNPDWASDPKFADPMGRWQHQEELDRLVARWTSQRTHYEATEALQRAGVAAAPSLSGLELLRDAHSRERGMFLEMEHPEIGKRIVVAPPWKLSPTPARVNRPSPLLGEHNEYVFGELLGMSRDEMERLQEERVIY